MINFQKMQLVMNRVRHTTHRESDSKINFGAKIFQTIKCRRCINAIAQTESA